MKKQTVTIEIASGLEARPVAILVQIASQYESGIYLTRDNKKVNAKSIMGMMTLGLDAGDSIEVSTAGDGRLPVRKRREEIGTGSGRLSYDRVSS